MLYLNTIPYLTCGRKSEKVYTYIQIENQTWKWGVPGAARGIVSSVIHLDKRKIHFRISIILVFWKARYGGGDWS